MARPFVDPRDGDIETDDSSPERRSLLALAGNLLAEVSLPKLALALILLIVLPAVLLGAAPLVATIWWSTVSSTRYAHWVGATIAIAILIGAAWYGGRPLLRAAERSFWSLNAIGIQPAYVTWREGLQHLSGRVVGKGASEDKRARARSVACALAGLMMCALALLVLWLVWPKTQLVATLGDLRSSHSLIVPALANAVVVAAIYTAIAGLFWGFADATMPQPREFTEFRSASDFVRSWRVAHVSDIHVVGERYGFRLGSGRAGPRGNENFVEVLRCLDELHRCEPLDAIVITGDLTDAGTSPEWAELLDAVEKFPRIKPLMITMPGNHDLNVVDRANPARLDLPTSPKKRLREVRTMSALAAIQGDTVNDVLAPYVDDMVSFADEGTRRGAKQIDGAWTSLFPIVLPPAREDGLGIIALNSNAETHFSFTNALGLVTVEQAYAVKAAMLEHPKAAWIVALHHHIVEHPKLGHALAERIGTTLINGNWFTRRLLGFADRAIVMHGHRHIDWIGACGSLLIVSAPSAVLPAKGSDDVYFYVHTIGVDASGRIGLASPARVTVSAART